MKKTLFLLLSMLLTATCAMAQGGPVLSSGIVVLGSTGRPVAGATVTFCSSGATGVPCSPTISVFSDVGLSVSAANPQITDGNGNVTVFAASGNYRYTVTGQGVSLTGQPFTASVSSSTAGTISGTILVNQVAFGIGGSSIGGSANFQWNSPVVGALNLSTSSADCVSADGALLALLNTNAALTSYLQKCNNGDLIINVDGQLIPSRGYLRWTSGGGATGDIDLRSGSNGAQLYCNTSANVGITLPQSSCQFHFFVGGVGTAKFELFSGSPNNQKYDWDAGTGCSTWFGSTSGSVSICPAAVQGSSNSINLPTSTASPGQHLQSNGGSPQQLSWQTIGVQCGTVAANGACANTLTQAEHCISGQATLAAGASTITGISPSFTSATSFSVITNDATTKANASNGAGASGTSITFSGTGTDTLNFVACGG